MTAESIKRGTKNEISKIPKAAVLGVRHLQIFLQFLNMIVVTMVNSNAVVSIVAMTNAATTNPDFPEYDWNEKQQSYILSSFYWGSFLTQLPGGFLCRRFGAKKVLFIATLGTGFCSLAIPLCVPWGGWQSYCVVNVLEGIFDGLMGPCINEHLAKWSPSHERHRLGALSSGGYDCGMMLTSFTTGIIAASAIGWPGTFYISGGLCFVWCGFWLVFGANNPPESRFTTQAERDYIEISLQHSDGFHKQKIPIPWRAIFTSVPLYAMLLGRCAIGWFSSTLEPQIPTYFNGVLKMDITKNAFFSALPHLIKWMLSYVYLIVADIVMKNKWTSLTTLKKSINTIAMWIPAACLIVFWFLDEDQEALAITLMVISVGMTSGTALGCYLNILDLSPNHAGILSGMVNVVANRIPIVTPLVASAIVSDKGGRTQWRMVFLIAAVVCFFGNLIFLIWGTAEQQPWNAEDYLLKKKRENQKTAVEIEEGNNECTDKRRLAQ